MTNRSPLQFFALVFALSLPFYLIGDLTKLQVVPGVPLSGFAFVCPVTARRSRLLGERKRRHDRVVEEILRLPTDQSEGLVGADDPSGARRRAPAIRARPLDGSAAPGAAISLRHDAGPRPRIIRRGAGRETGLVRIHHRSPAGSLGALQAGLLVGLVWAVWHFVALAQVGRPPVWIA